MVSSKSAWSYIKKLCDQLIVKELCTEMVIDHPLHLPHIDIILLPYMSSPRVVMSCRIPGHCIQNWNFLFGILCKIRLPVYDQDAFL